MRILYFYPENPLLLNQGNNSRANALLHYFKSRSIEVDLVGVESKDFSLDSINELTSNGLINKGYLLKEFKRKSNKIIYFFCYSLPNLIFGRIKHFNRIRIYHQSYFNSILKSNEYDYIIISYAYWAELVIDNPYIKEAKLCIDTHDFLTSQFQYLRSFSLGKYFQKEIELLRKFDKIFVISVEENYLFSQFMRKEVITLSHIIENNLTEKGVEKKYDLIYVASSNSHNVSAANWFFKEVFPLLSKEINIVVIGKVCDYIQDDENIVKIRFAENLNDYYLQSKVAICPMLSGTGLKIKVIEALSFGLPIVCNTRGVDGMSSKFNNGCLVTDNPQEFARSIELLLSDKKYYFEISNFGREYFIINNDKETCYKKIDAIFN
ncbi:glycosyltransferase [Flavobacterium taihuense]|uniref:Glycosyltransferase n=1 Tax=Flavobacterium taihuense TaxID=2857508 RepID=A0ABS6XVU2_9FLAO|nr:glycosyltransferase [Flavobacterium taihuense]MBW4360786.1 glycosyltransferase [Flavobacterium taihuense]